MDRKDRGSEPPRFVASFVASCQASCWSGADKNKKELLFWL
jgi:hypothetical protein